MLSRVLSIAFLVAACAGCSTGLSDKNLVYIGVADAATLLTGPQGALDGSDGEIVVVDPRPSWSYRKGHIPKSINIPFGQLKIQLWKLEGAGVVIVTGETYNDSVALAMSKTLLNYGFKDVRTLRGGLTSWEDAGEPVLTTQ
tara:strand:+ start:285 stop:710 length:426 start_codon:yes stop_codon:yes gene_type:complete